MSYQYNYDANGNPVGVFIPIKEWEIITSKLKNKSNNKATISKEKILQVIKKGMLEVNDIENKKIKSIPLQKLLDAL